MNDVMIEAKDLSKRYGAVTALAKATFDVRRGEVVGFVGPNGAGKTTTMKILTCFIAPSDGTARVNGCDVFDDPIGVRRAIGYLPEHNPLYTEMLVYDYLTWCAEMRGLAKDDARRRIKTVVEQTSIGDVVAREIRTLSKGYRQRVGLAQALVHEPPLLILDEPMSGLDPNQAVEIRDLIKAIGRERTVILSTHNLAEVQVACSRVLVIAKGKLVADDTPEELRNRAGRARFVVAVHAQGAALDATAAKAQAAFERIPGVERVLRGSSGGAPEIEFSLVPRGDDDLRADVFKAAVEAGLVLVGLRREGENLERVFRELTLGGEAGQGPDGPKKDTPRRSDAADTAGEARP